MVWNDFLGGNSVEPTRQILGELASRAGTILRSHFRQALQVREKPGDLGLVTQADLESEAFLVGEIRRAFPEDGILAEEGGRQGRGTNGCLWVIDPLDGTTNFASGNPYHCVSIAWGKGEGLAFRPQLAAIYHPATSDLYTAQLGGGAWLGETRLFPAPSPLGRAVVATGLSSLRGPDLERLLGRLATLQGEILALRMNGAAALDLALTARGIYQGFVEERLAPWDLAAGSLLAQEAGRTVVTPQGGTFESLAPEGAIACGQKDVALALVRAFSHG